jgi:hypothetical protein
LLLTLLASAAIVDLCSRTADHLSSFSSISMADQVATNSPYETFSDVAKELFADGIYNWGRIVTLFYFTYKLILKVSPCSHQCEATFFTDPLILVTPRRALIHAALPDRMDGTIRQGNRCAVDRAQRRLGKCSCAWPCAMLTSIDSSW